MNKIRVKIDGEWVKVESRNVKSDDHTFLHNDSVEKLKNKMVESHIDNYARGRVPDTWLRTFPGSGSSPIANMYKDRFAYDLEAGEVYLKDNDGYAADENGRITLKKYFDHRPELLNL